MNDDELVISLGALQREIDQRRTPDCRHPLAVGELQALYCVDCGVYWTGACVEWFMPKTRQRLLNLLMSRVLRDWAKQSLQVAIEVESMFGEGLEKTALQLAVDRERLACQLERGELSWS